MKLLLLLTLSAFSCSALALNRAACSRLLNNGLYKKYSYNGVDYPLTKATKIQGSTQGMSATSFEATSGILDPKYWSNVSTSGTQSTTSTGACSLIGLNDLKEKRELYWVQNKTEILEDIARGEGGNLEVLALFSLCDEKSYGLYTKQLRSRFNQLKDSDTFGAIADDVVELDRELSQSCYSHRKTSV